MQKSQNDQTNSHCYCNGPIDPLGLEAMQHCQQCNRYFHFNCLKSSNRPKLWLLSDRFWQLTCENCNSEEKMVRMNLSWVQLVQLILYNLIQHHTIKLTHPSHPFVNSVLISASKSSNVKGDHIYFRWKEDICRIIDLYWSELCPDRVRSPTWNNTVASALSTNSKIFLSGSQIFDIGGWWSLHQSLPPTLTQKAMKKGSLPLKNPTPVMKKPEPQPQPISRKISPPIYTPNKKTLPLKKYYIAKSKDGLSSDSENTSSGSSASNSPSNLETKPSFTDSHIPAKRSISEDNHNDLKKPTPSKLIDYSSDESSLTSLDDLQSPESSPESMRTTSHYNQSPSPLTSSPSPQYSHLTRVSNPTPRLTHQGLDNLVAELVGIPNYGGQMNE